MSQSINTSLNHYYKLLTHRFYWHYQLMICSAIALIFSLITWLLGLSVIWQLTSVGIGFSLGFFWPVRYRKRQALNWFDENIGLSYRTLLELETNNQEEKFGFKEALQRRSSYLLARINLPRMLPWWLLLVGCALGATLLPDVSLPATSRTSTSLLEDFYVPAKQVRQTNSEQGQSEQNLKDGTQKVAQPQEDLLLEDQSRISPARNNSDTAPNSTNNKFNPTLVDSEVLEQLLENTNKPEENPANPFKPIENPPQDITEVEIEDSPQDIAETEVESELSPNEDSRLINTESPDSLDSEASQGNEDQQLTSSEDVQSGENEQVSNDPESEQANGASSEQNQRQQQFQSDANNDSEETTAVQEVADSAEGEQLNTAQEHQESNPTASSANQSGGTGTNNSSSSNNESLEAGSGELTRLEGKLLDGPSSLAGETNLPGLVEDNFPRVNPSNDFKYSAEEAITEGSIPLEYQEILRNYFR